MRHVEMSQWVVWTRLFAGYMKSLTLLTHDRCGQLVSIVSIISIKTSWNIWHVDTTQWGVWTWLWVGVMEVLTSTNDACGNLVILVRCVSATLSMRNCINDIMNTIWARTISEYSEKNYLEHQKNVGYLETILWGVWTSFQSIRENFVILHLVIIISIGTYWVRWVAFS